MDDVLYFPLQVVVGEINDLINGYSVMSCFISNFPLFLDDLKSFWPIDKEIILQRIQTDLLIPGAETFSGTCPSEPPAFRNQATVLPKLNWSVRQLSFILAKLSVHKISHEDRSPKSLVFAAELP